MAQSLLIHQFYHLFIYE